MDKVKSAYTWLVAWVEAHPQATVNLIIGAAVVRAALKIFV